MMASEQGWRDLRLAFEAILHRDLRNTWIEAVYYPQGFDGTGRVGIPGLPGKWDVHNGADERGRSDFRQLAKAAAVADGCPNIEAGWIYWLEAIRANSLGTPTPGVNRSDGHERVDWVQRARGQDHREPIICNGYELQPFYDRDTFRVYKNEPIIQFENVCYTSGQYCMLLAAGGVRRPSELVPTNGGILDDASRLETQGPTASAERQREQRAKASRPKPSPTLATNLSELRQFTRVTVDYLSEKVGIDRNAIMKHARCQQRVTPATLAGYAVAFSALLGTEITVDDLHDPKLLDRVSQIAK